MKVIVLHSTSHFLSHYFSIMGLYTLGIRGGQDQVFGIGIGITQYIIDWDWDCTVGNDETYCVQIIFNSKLKVMCTIFMYWVIPINLNLNPISNASTHRQTDRHLDMQRRILHSKGRLKKKKKLWTPDNNIPFTPYLLFYFSPTYPIAVSKF